MRRNMLALLLAVLFAFSACAAPSGVEGVSGGSVTQLALPDAGVVPALSAAANAGITRFGVELLRQARDGEILLSPFSAAMALSMTANGANGDTLAEFEDVLGAGLNTLNANAASLLAGYADLGGSTSANIANSLWADVAMRFYDQFLAGCAGYGPGVFLADLDTDSAREAVNWWIGEQTRGMIPEALAKNLDSTIVALLINVVYLDNTWSNRFKPESTRQMPFYPAGGGNVTIDFMNQTEYLPYISAGGVTGAVLPYDDGRLAFVALMPEDGLDSLLETLDGEGLTALIASAQKVMLRLSLPKFTAEWSGDLSNVLRGMGLTTAFDDEQADFTNLGTCGNGNIYLEFVIQSTKLEVDEDGSRAAAATIVAPAGNAAPDQTAVLTLDRPFLYAIWDTHANIPLFLGTFEGI